jgi:predicted nuclease of predicted toxin-antitoxin system
MKILLDECVDWRLRRELPGLNVTSVPRHGWAGIKNGKLLALAEKEFDVFVTMDGSLSSQQPLSKFNIAIILLRAKSNQIRDIKPLVPELLRQLPLAQKGGHTIVRA